LWRGGRMGAGLAWALAPGAAWGMRARAGSERVPRAGVGGRLTRRAAYFAPRRDGGRARARGIRCAAVMLCTASVDPSGG
jgi:hypothetical protein